MIQRGEEGDQLELLEQKVESLVRYVSSVKREKEELTEKIHIQEERITALTDELERLRLSRDKARQSVLSLLEKIEGLGI